MTSSKTEVIRSFDAKIDDVNTEKRSVVVRINTAAVDRYATVIDPRGGQFANYRKLGQPVLWEHGKDPRRGTDPIATNRDLWNNGGPVPTELIAEPRFLENDEFAQRRFELYRDGVIRGWSVNILPLPGGTSPPTKEELRARPDWEKANLVYRTWDLAEFSGVVIPGNADCLTADRAAKILDYVDRGLLWIPDDARAWIEAGGVAGGAAIVTPPLNGEGNECEPPQEEPRLTKQGNKWLVMSGKVVVSEWDSEEEATSALKLTNTNAAEGKPSAPRPTGKPMMPPAENAGRSVQRHIEKHGDKWVVLSESGKLLGTHDSHEGAVKQLEAVEANKHKESGRHIVSDGQHWIIHEADGRPLIGVQDAELAQEILRSLDHSTEFSQFHAKLVNEARVMFEELRSDLKAMINLTFHGKVS